MATESVIGPRKVDALDKINHLNRINELTGKAGGILAMMMAADVDDLPSDAVHNASQAVRDILWEIHELATQGVTP